MPVLRPGHGTNNFAGFGAIHFGTAVAQRAGMRFKQTNKLWLAAAALVSLSASPAFAYQFVAESMETWNGCDYGCAGQTKLNYTDDQIRMFTDAMNDAGWGRASWWRNQDVWGTDTREDWHPGGQDNVYVDPYTMYIYSGHGEATNGTSQTFVAPMCHASIAEEFACRARSSKIRLGERTGLYAASSGNIRYLIYATCFSVHTQPNKQWEGQLRYGGDMIFGYRGLSADSEYTDEVPADFAWEAFDDDDRFKASWFWAIEDWWVDDTGSLITAGVNLANATHRRDQMRNYWARRPNAEEHVSRAWSWHEG